MYPELVMLLRDAALPSQGYHFTSLHPVQQGTSPDKP